KLKEKGETVYERALAFIYGTYFWLSIAVALIVTLYAKDIVVVLYGERFIEAGSALCIIMWASVFAGMGSLNARYFSIERKEKVMARRMICALFLNIFFNLALIPVFGIEGAAVSTLFSLAIANY